MRTAGICCVALLSLVFSGCGSGEDANLPALVPVTGTVRLDGQPLRAALVTFVPSAENQGMAASGYTDEQGKYELRTLHRSAGAPVGQYTVTVSKLVLKDGSDFPPDSEVSPMDAGADEKLPPQYSDLARSTLKATVAEGGQPIDFDLKSKP